MSAAGAVATSLQLDPATRRSKGCAIVDFETAEDAAAALVARTTSPAGRCSCASTAAAAAEAAVDRGCRAPRPRRGDAGTRRHERS